MQKSRIIETNTTPFKTVDLDPITLDIIESALRNARYRDGRGAVPHRDVARHPRAARRVSADRRPQGQMVVGQFGSFIGGFLRGYDGTIEDGDIFLMSDPYSVRRRDQPRERLAGAAADLLQGRAPDRAGPRCSAT